MKNLFNKIKNNWMDISLNFFYLFVFFWVSVFGIDSYMKTNQLTFIKFTINPEFVLVVNGKDEVVQYLSLNQDAKEIYKSEMFKGLKCDEAVNKAIDIAKENDYIKEDNNEIDVSIVSNKENETKEYEEKVVNIVKKKDKNIVSNIVEPTKEEKNNISKVTKKELNNKKELDKIETIYKKEENIQCKYTDVDYIKMGGKDRFETAINISKEVYKKGTDNVILVSSTDLYESNISLSLSAVLDASILYIEKD